MGERLQGHTDKIMLSFLNDYRKVASNMKGFRLQPLTSTYDRGKGIMQYELIVKFRTSKRARLYSGESYVKKNLSDQLDISENSIILKFTRSHKVVTDKMLYSANSIFRFELQRALCFYLAVNGYIPDVSSIILKNNNETVPINHFHFTDIWQNCHCDRLFVPDDLKIVFQNHPQSKHVYIALTYWLKAQLDPFVNDRFRALWSGFNALYDAVCEGRKTEREKLDNFRDHFMSAENYPISMAYLQKYSEAIFRECRWYDYINKKKPKRIAQLIDQYPDTNTQEILIKYSRGIKKGNPEIAQVLDKCEQSATGSGTDYFAQLRFLLTEYIYSIRNGYFHAEKAYPLFTISRESVKQHEEYLCDVLSNVVFETIKILSKSESR